MGLKAWVGFLACSMFTVIFYVAIWPAWIPLKEALIANTGLPGISPSLVPICTKVLDWVPLMINIAALVWAFVSPATESYSTTWRGY